MKQICVHSKCDALQNFFFSKTRIDPREFWHDWCQYFIFLNPQLFLFGYSFNSIQFKSISFLHYLRYLHKCTPCIRWMRRIRIRSSRVEILEYADWSRNHVDRAKSGIFFIQWGRHRAKFFTVNIQDGAESNVIASSCFLDFSSSLWSGWTNWRPYKLNAK